VLSSSREVEGVDVRVVDLLTAVEEEEAEEEDEEAVCFRFFTTPPAAPEPTTRLRLGGELDEEDGVESLGTWYVCSGGRDEGAVASVSVPVTEVVGLGLGLTMVFVVVVIIGEDVEGGG
jgi:hypothetical protein